MTDIFSVLQRLERFPVGRLGPGRLAMYCDKGRRMFFLVWQVAEEKWAEVVAHLDMHKRNSGREDVIHAKGIRRGEIAFTMSDGALRFFAKWATKGLVVRTVMRAHAQARAALGGAEAPQEKAMAAALQAIEGGPSKGYKAKIA